MDFLRRGEEGERSEGKGAEGGRRGRERGRGRRERGEAGGGKKEGGRRRREAGSDQRTKNKEGKQRQEVAIQLCGRKMSLSTCPLQTDQINTEHHTVCVLSVPQAYLIAIA